MPLVPYRSLNGALIKILAYPYFFEGGVWPVIKSTLFGSSGSLWFLGLFLSQWRGQSPAPLPYWHSFSDKLDLKLFFRNSANEFVFCILLLARVLSSFPNFWWPFWESRSCRNYFIWRNIIVIVFKFIAKYYTIYRLFYSSPLTPESFHDWVDS